MILVSPRILNLRLSSLRRPSALLGTFEKFPRGLVTFAASNAGMSPKGKALDRDDIDAPRLDAATARQKESILSN